MAHTHAANIDIKAALAEAEERYRADNPKSLAQHRAACAAMPGGNTRASIHVDPFPLTMAHGEGARLWDLDGHEYADFLSEFTAGIYGHSHPAIRRAIEEALMGGLNFGAHTAAEARFAEAICARFPSIELVRFTNSGTEANLMAVSRRARDHRPAEDPGLRGRLSRRRLLFPRPWQPAERAVRVSDRPLQRPRCGRGAGPPLPRRTRRDPDRADAGHAPAASRPGAIFSPGLRALADETGALLIFDEVMTSRLAPGGLQEVHGILPDLTTLGKYLGGGMSFGAFGGRADIMEHFDPRRPDAFQHAGTFNNNVLTMNAGLVGLTEIYTPERARALNEWGDRLRERLNAVVPPARAQNAVHRLGLDDVGPHDRGRRSARKRTPARGNAALRDLFCFDLVARGIWFAKRGMFALSIALDDRDADKLADAVEDFAQTRAPLFEGIAAG